MLVLYKLHSSNQLLLSSLDNLSISQTASWHSLGSVMCFALLQSKISPEDCHGSQVKGMACLWFLWFWEVLERKVKNKMLTADTKQCLPSTNVCTHAEALQVPDVTIKASLLWKHFDYSHIFFLVREGKGLNSGNVLQKTALEMQR